MSPFSIPGWNISEIKNPNGTRELIGQKQKNVSKNPKSFFKVLLKTVIIFPLLVSPVLFILSKQSNIKDYFMTFASNTVSSKKSTPQLNENNNVVNKTVTEKKTKNAQTKNVVEQKAIQPVTASVVIKDYSGSKPWEAFNIIKNDLKTTDNKKVLNSLFDYLSSFKIESNGNNRSLATVWKTKYGSVKNVSELFSYVINTSGNVKCYTVKTSTGKYWNEVNISGTTIIYDILNKKVSTDSSSYQNGYKY